MLRGALAMRASQPEKVPKLLATKPDGTGSQILAVSVKRGGQRALAMPGLKRDFGVQDAYMLPSASVTEQLTIFASLEIRSRRPDHLAEVPDRRA